MDNKQFNCTIVFIPSYEGYERITEDFEVDTSADVKVQTLP
jgi:hypothetical protein